jgi:ATP-grasp domain
MTAIIGSPSTGFCANTSSGFPEDAFFFNVFLNPNRCARFVFVICLVPANANANANDVSEKWIICETAASLQDGWEQAASDESRRQSNAASSRMPVPLQFVTLFRRNSSKRRSCTELKGHLMRTVLLTCGRGVYALTLARAFHAAGHKVLVADALPRTLCRLSNAVERYFHVPSPALGAAEWLAAILRIVDCHAVDLIVPVYEEVFYLTQGLETLSSPPPVFASDFETMKALHHKWLFSCKARSLGLAAPDTRLLISREQLLHDYARGDGAHRVFKAAYSRFAAQTVVRPTNLRSLAGVEPTPARPWLAQEFVEGRPYATFSIAHRGRLTAHATYATDFCHAFGPTVVYRRADRPHILDWVRRFVAAIRYTGQIGFDFIEERDGGVKAIECNPRLTGGLYLLKDHPRFADAYFDPQMERIDAVRDRSFAFRFWLFATLFRHTSSFPGFREWARHFFFARSTNALSRSDPLPRLLGPLVFWEFMARCLLAGQSPREMITRDFEWNEDRSAETWADSSAALRRPA